MKTMFFCTTMLLGLNTLSQAQNTEHVDMYDRARVTEYSTTTRQIINPDANGHQHITTTTTDKQTQYGINHIPNVQIDGQPVFEVKKQIDTDAPITTYDRVKQPDAMMQLLQDKQR